VTPNAHDTGCTEGTENTSPVPRLGLALSGGGFRAALFHVGVLARLADLDLLRRVEVISTVSGGSIVGALYYVRLKRLLESTRDEEVTRQTYRTLVMDVESDLRTAVQKNIRMRVFANLFKNVRMARLKYSRSDRIGDLYDRHIYKPAWGRERPRKRFGPLPGAERQIELRELLIRPCGTGGDFDPETDNPGRAAKVPILLLNATTLNTGHSWRFEAVRMGEPYASNENRRAISEDIDKNERLEQGYFAARPGQRQIPKAQRDFPLALAVAASACVPGVFHPLAITQLYRDRTVQLVDGGVHDNQGVQGLLDQDCTHLIISDASRQLGDVHKPSSRIPGVVGRTMGLQGDRIRDEQLTSACLSATGYALMHLRKGLRGSVLPPGDDAVERPEREGPTDCRAFGIDPAVQAALSNMRTDLDFFSDVEAAALAQSAYRMSTDELSRPEFEKLSAPSGTPDCSGYDFDQVDVVGSQDYLRQLEASKLRFFRPLMLAPGAPWTWAGPVAIAAVAIVWFVIARWDDLENLMSGEWAVWAVCLAVAAPTLLAALYMYRGGPKPLRLTVDFVTSSVLPLPLAPVLWLWATLNRAFAPLSLIWGRLDRS
jgi:NTE family protein